VVTLRLETCEATARGEQSEALLDRRMAWLDQTRRAWLACRMTADSISRGWRRPSGWLRLGVLLFAAAVAGCRPPAPSPEAPDAGGSTCGGDNLEACLPRPVLPSWVCPPGWLAEPAYQPHDDERPSSFVAHSICAPPPLPRSCGPGSMPVVGAAACAPIGAPCPAGPWPSDLPTNQRILYVSPGAAGGDGNSPQAPLGSIAAAQMLAAAGQPTIIALAKGTYDERVYLSGPITLWGACAAETSVRFLLDSEIFATVLISGADGAVVKNLSVTGPRLGIRIESAAVLSGIEVHDAVVAGVVVGSGATATLNDFVVRRTQSRPSDRQLGVGLQVFQGATVNLTRTLFEGNRMAGVMVLDADAGVTAADLAVFDTRPTEADGLLGIGLLLQNQAVAAVSRAAFEGNATAAILVAGSTATLEDVVVRDSVSNRQGDGMGLYLHSAGKATVQRALFERNQSLGVYVRGATLTLTDAVVRDTREIADGTLGGGITVTDDGSLQLSRSVLDGNRTAGLDVEDAQAHVTVNQVVIRQTQPRSADGVGGFGLQLISGCQVEVDHSVLEYNRQHGILVGGNASRLQLRDSWVTDTLAVGSPFGHGMGCQNPSACSLTRTLVAHNAGVGVLYSKAVGVLADSWVVANTVGIHAQLGSSLETGALEPATLAPGEVFVRDDTVFLENLTRVGSGSLPLPTLLNHGP